MIPINYFKKNGEIYGISTQVRFGVRKGYAIRFTDYQKAVAWLRTEEYGFRDRELVSKTAASSYPFLENEEE